MDTELSRFLNALKSLNFVDRTPLEKALGRQCGEAEWQRFRSHPWAWIMHAPDKEAEAVWRIIRPRD